MFCKKCGTQLPDDAEFCSACGTKQSAKDCSSNCKTNPQGVKTGINTSYLVGVIVCAIALLIVMVFVSVNIQNMMEERKTDYMCVAEKIEYAESSGNEKKMKEAYEFAREWIKDTEDMWFDGATKAQRRAVMEWIESYERVKRIMEQIEDIY